MLAPEAPGPGAGLEPCCPRRDWKHPPPRHPQQDSTVSGSVLGPPRRRLRRPAGLGSWLQAALPRRGHITSPSPDLGSRGGLAATVGAAQQDLELGCAELRGLCPWDVPWGREEDEECGEGGQLGVK